MKPKLRAVTKLDVFTMSEFGIVGIEHVAPFGRILGAPKDMLRYDTAFQCLDPLMASAIFIPTYKVPGQGIMKGVATLGRWKSFQVTLAPADREMVSRVMDSVFTKPDYWVTYHHPMEGRYGPRDYSKLVPVTYADWLKEELR